MVGKEVFFEFKEEVIELLDVRLEYVGFVGIYGAVITNIIMPEHNENGEFVIELDAAEGKRMYASKMYFVFEADLKRFREKENHIEEFKELILSILVDTFYTRISMPKLRAAGSRSISAS